MKIRSVEHLVHLRKNSVKTTEVTTYTLLSLREKDYSPNRHVYSVKWSRGARVVLY